MESLSRKLPHRKSDIVGFATAPSVFGLVVYTLLDLRNSPEIVLELLSKFQNWNVKRFSAIPVGKRTARYLKLDRNRERLIQTVERREVDSISMDDYENGTIFINIELDHAQRFQENKLTNRVSLSVKGNVAEINNLIMLGSEVYSLIDGIYGCIMLDSDFVELEHRMSGFMSNILDEQENKEVRNWSVHQQEMKTMARDAFLVNYLNPTHIEKLGGIDKIRALPFVKEVTEQSNHTMILLDWKLGEDVNKLNNVLKLFREFISSISIRSIK